jgi:predicted ATP-binding protein involved in virulence
MKDTVILVTNNGMGKADLLILCSTCLDFYNLSDQIQVGIVGGMSDIIEAQTKASNVITI